MIRLPPSPAQANQKRWRLQWLIAFVMIAIASTVFFVQRFGPAPDVTIALSYVGDNGRTYSCTYDYRTSRKTPMPAPIAKKMSQRDWSQTGQLIYEWAKTHPAGTWTTQDELPANDPRSTRADATWSLAMDRYVKFPSWTVDAGQGPEFELWWEARPGSNCEDGLR